MLPYPESLPALLQYVLAIATLVFSVKPAIEHHIHEQTSFGGKVTIKIGLRAVGSMSNDCHRGVIVSHFQEYLFRNLKNRSAALLRFWLQFHPQFDLTKLMGLVLIDNS